MAATPHTDHTRTAEQDAAMRLEHAVSRARRVILWERAWPPLVGLASLAAVFLAVSWAGLWLHLPPFARMAGVAAFIGVLVWRLWALAHTPVSYTHLTLPTICSV